MEGLVEISRKAQKKTWFENCMHDLVHLGWVVGSTPYCVYYLGAVKID